MFLGIWDSSTAIELVSVTESRLMRQKTAILQLHCCQKAVLYKLAIATFVVFNFTVAYKQRKKYIKFLCKVKKKIYKKRVRIVTQQ